VVARHVEQPQSVARYQTSNNSGEGRQASFHLMLSFPASRTGSRGKCHGTQPLHATKCKNAVNRSGNSARGIPIMIIASNFKIFFFFFFFPDISLRQIYTRYALLSTYVSSPNASLCLTRQSGPTISIHLPDLELPFTKQLGLEKLGLI
jgi:hypothetical protein